MKGCKTFKPIGSFAVGEFTVANALGVVQVLNNGHVWLKPNQSPNNRMVLASAMATFLLYNKLYDATTSIEPNP